MIIQKLRQLFGKSPKSSLSIERTPQKFSYEVWLEKNKKVEKKNEIKTNQAMSYANLYSDMLLRDIKLQFGQQLMSQNNFTLGATTTRPYFGKSILDPYDPTSI